MYFNDPEEEDSQSGCENLFEAEYEWLSKNDHVAAAKDVIITGPTCLSTAARNRDSAESDIESDEDEDEPGELPEGLWLMDTGSGHDLTTPSGAEGFATQ